VEAEGPAETRSFTRPSGSARTERTEEPVVIAHIVLFNPKPNLSTQDVQLFAQQLRLTVNSVTSVRRAMVGKRLAVQDGDHRNFGDATYEFAAVVEFDDPDGLSAYLAHPAHQELGRLFWLYCASTVVVEVRSVDAKSDEVFELLVSDPN
jgi:hypothetical protein